MVTLLVFFAIGVANADSYSIQLFDQQGQPIILPDEKVAVIAEPPNMYLHGQVQGAITVTSTLSNFITTTSTDGLTTFSGQTTGYQTELTVGDKVIIIQPKADDPQTIFGLTYLEVGLIAVAIVAILIIAILLTRERG
ncbi:MAG: hypothetical protein ACREBA_08485 [Nitrosotalea sp.]